MRSGELAQFLAPYQDVLTLTTRVQNLLLMNTDENSTSRFVTFSSLEGHSLGLQADVLHVRVVGRFEASKYEVNGRPFITGQFAFYRKIGEQDVRLPVAIRFVPSEHVHLPSGNVITIFAGMDNDNPAIKYGIHSIRKEISEVLLSEVVAGIEEWKFK